MGVKSREHKMAVIEKREPVYRVEASPHQPLSRCRLCGELVAEQNKIFHFNKTHNNRVN